MPFSRRRRARSTTTLSGAVAHRLLDGSDDAPAPLRQLLAAATAPASAALALTASTAGGVALATNSYSAHPPQSPVVSGSARAGAQVSGVSPSGMSTSTAMQTPGGDDRSDSSAPLGEAGDDGIVPPRADAAASPGPAGPCEARCTTNAAESPARPPGQPGQHSSPPPRADSGDDSGNGNEPQEQKTDNAKNPNSNKPEKEKKEKSADNGKKPEKSNNSDGAKNPGKNDKVGGNGRSDPASKQAGAEKGADKKKTDA
jgi:hypothetical protein